MAALLLLGTYLDPLRAARSVSMVIRPSFFTSNLLKTSRSCSSCKVMRRKSRALMNSLYPTRERQKRRRSSNTKKDSGKRLMIHARTTLCADISSGPAKTSKELFSSFSQSVCEQHDRTSVQQKRGSSSASSAPSTKIHEETDKDRHVQRERGMSPRVVPAAVRHAGEQTRCPPLQLCEGRSSRPLTQDDEAFLQDLGRRQPRLSLLPMKPCCWTSIESTIAASSLSMTRNPAVCMPSTKNKKRRDRRMRGGRARGWEKCISTDERKRTANTTHPPRETRNTSKRKKRKSKKVPHPN